MYRDSLHKRASQSQNSSIIDLNDASYVFSSTEYPGDDGLMPGYYELLDLNSSLLEKRAFGFTIAGSASPVPLPSAVWLLGSGLVGLIGVVRHERR